MSRLVVILSFATLSLLPSCVDLKLPPKISSCEQEGKCTNGGATGGNTGTGAGGDSRPGDAGASDTLGGRGGHGGGTGNTGGTGGQASSGTTGGSSTGTSNTTGGTSDTGGTGGQASGGTSGSPDGGVDAQPDAAVEKPFSKPETYFDTYTNPDVFRDTPVGPEASTPDSGPDAPPDSSPDSTPDRPDTAFETPSCIQTFKSNGYAFSNATDAGVNSCSECKENNTVSKEAACKTMTDCLIANWVCKSNAPCWNTCFNAASGDSVLDGCMKTLISRACPGW